MNTSKVIPAHFSKIGKLSASSKSGTLQMSLSGMPGTVYEIETSTNLATWTLFLTITNAFIPTKFFDAVQQEAPFRMYRAVPQ